MSELWERKCTAGALAGHAVSSTCACAVCRAYYTQRVVSEVGEPVVATDADIRSAHERSVERWVNLGVTAAMGGKTHLLDSKCPCTECTAYFRPQQPPAELMSILVSALASARCPACYVTQGEAHDPLCEIAGMLDLTDAQAAATLRSVAEIHADIDALNRELAALTMEDATPPGLLLVSPLGDATWWTRL